MNFQQLIKNNDPLLSHVTSIPMAPWYTPNRPTILERVFVHRLLLSPFPSQPTMPCRPTNNQLGKGRVYISGTQGTYEGDSQG